VIAFEHLRFRNARGIVTIQESCGECEATEATSLRTSVNSGFPAVKSFAEVLLSALAARDDLSEKAMHVTDLAIHKMLGMQLAAEGEAHLLVLPDSPVLLNHVGTIHAGVQFALAEACSGELLLRYFGDEASHIFAVLRTSKVKFHNPARGELRASAKFVHPTVAFLTDQLASRGRTFASIVVDVSDKNAVVTMSGRYEWFVRRERTSA
jgi:acyl-coenzyme A thioesterase PaaI-like protein